MRVIVCFAGLLLAHAAATVAAWSQVTETPGAPLPADHPQEAAAPELLPRSGALPEPPPAPLYPNLSRSPKPGKPVPEALQSAEPEPTPFISEEQRRQDEQRLNRIRAVAMRNPEAVALLRLASSALSVEARRNYLRAYYVTVCMRMREMEPHLGGYIREFERDRIRAIGRAKNPEVPAVTAKRRE